MNIRRVAAIVFSLGLMPLAPSAEPVPKDLAIKLTIKGCASTSVTDTFRGTYSWSGDGKTRSVPVRLTQSEKRWLDTLIAESGVFDLPVDLPDNRRSVSEPGPDEFNLEVRRAGRHRTLSWTGPSFDFDPATEQLMLNPGDATLETLGMLIDSITRVFAAIPAIKRLPRSQTICL